MTKWAERFIQMAEFVAQWSKDPSTKCGAVIVGKDNEVLATGFNGFPRGVAEEEKTYVGLDDHDDGDGWITQLNSRWERPAKYEWVEHAERNAIYNAARSGVRLDGSTMFLNYAVACCADCTRAIIQSGIRKVVGPTRPFPGQGKGVYYDAHGASVVMLQESGVQVENVDAGL